MLFTAYYWTLIELLLEPLTATSNDDWRLEGETDAN
jgi:hypothetical protein